MCFFLDETKFKTLEEKRPDEMEVATETYEKREEKEKGPIVSLIKWIY